MNPHHAEQRRQPRWRVSEILHWRPERTPDFRTGLAIERSADSLAFAWRGDVLPRRGTLVELRRSEPDEAISAPMRAVVRSARLVHADLAIISAGILHTRGFPPARARAVSTGPGEVMVDEARGFGGPLEVEVLPLVTFDSSSVRMK